MRRRLQRISRDEVICLNEVAAHLWRKEQDCGEHNQEHRYANDILNCVVRMEGDAIQWDMRLRVFLLFNLDTIWIVGANFMQCNQMGHDQT